MNIPPYPGTGFVPPVAMQPYFGPDGRAHSCTTNNYLNALFETDYQLEDMCYAFGLQQMQAGAPVSGFMNNPNLAYYDSMIAPGMSRASNFYTQTMNGQGNRHSGNQHVAGADAVTAKAMNNATNTYLAAMNQHA